MSGSKCYVENLNNEYFILCVIFHVKAGLRGAIMLHHLRRGLAPEPPHQHRALLHSPGHVVLPLLLQ